MSKTVINLVIILGIATVAFAGYFILKQQEETLPDSVKDQLTLQTMLENTKVFIGHRETLEKVQLDISIFEDDRFTSLESYTTDIESRPVRNANPFVEKNASNPND
ncbi:MAG: hypothetical protein KBC35_02785 [Candidatus Pacebacteria bacterium]|nr:hypothetical protein [Candidatus Paceibacterota bacterium]